MLQGCWSNGLNSCRSIIDKNIDGSEYSKCGRNDKGRTVHQLDRLDDVLALTKACVSLGSASIGCLTVRAVRTRFAPSAANLLAVAAPIPRLAPVMTAVFPCRTRSTLFCSFNNCLERLVPFRKIV